MEAKKKNHEPCELDPSLPVDWRAQDARRIVAGEKTVRAADSDSYVAAYVRFLRSLANGKSQRRLSAGSQGTAITAAHELAHRDDPGLWELKSRVLANQAVEEIASRVGLSTEAIVCFEALFFDVRCRLDRHMWITNEVIGIGLWRGFRNDELDKVWMVHAYHGGLVALEVFLTSFYRAWQPGEPATLSVYFRDGTNVDPHLQSAVAVRALPLDVRGDEVCMAIHMWLLEADRTDDEDRRAFLQERARDFLVRCARAQLAGHKLPRPRRRPQRQDNKRQGTAVAHDVATPRFLLETTMADFVGSIPGLKPDWAAGSG